MPTLDWVETPQKTEVRSMDSLTSSLHNGTYIFLMLGSLILYHKAKQNRWPLWGAVMAVLFMTLSFSIGEMHLDFTKTFMELGGSKNFLMTMTGFGPLAISAIIGLGILAVFKRKGGTPTLRANAALSLNAMLAIASGSYWTHTYASKPATMMAIGLQEGLVKVLNFAADAISAIKLG